MRLVKIEAPPKTRQNLTLSWAATIIISFFILAPIIANAQTPKPELMVTWEAKNYAPPNYIGRTLPTMHTTVQMGLNLIDNNKIIDLSKSEIFWLLNGNHLEKGIGQTKFSFRVPRFENQKIDVTVSNYKNSNLSKLVIIPSIEPEVIIDVPTNNQILGKTTFRIGALPYFFNVRFLKDLTINWQVNDFSLERSADRAQYVDIDTRDISSVVSISARVRNNSALLEDITRKINFIVE